jgi:hypothetical protein
MKSVRRRYPSKREKKRRPTDFTTTATWPKIKVGQISSIFSFQQRNRIRALIWQVLTLHLTTSVGDPQMEKAQCLTFLLAELPLEGHADPHDEFIWKQQEKFDDIA